MEQPINTDFRGCEPGSHGSLSFLSALIRVNSLFHSPSRLLFTLICVGAFFFSSCSSKPTDLRSLAPAESLVYLESNDLEASLKPIIESRAFNEAATRRPDISALKGIQLAVAVTGFETSEVELTDEHSVGRVQPKFVAIADTHAWNYQALAFAEHGLGAFVANVYGGEPELEKTDKHGGKYFKWSADDGRSAHAVVIDSLVYFGNDEPAIEKALAVRRAESDSFAKTGKLTPATPGTLASGYISTDGVAQIASIAGMGLASQTSDDEDVRLAIAGILPQLIRGTFTDVRWEAQWGKPGFEDKFTIGVNAETAPALAEAFAATPNVEPELFQYTWGKAPSVTLYNLDNPSVAWQALQLVSRSKLDGLASQIVGEFSNEFAEPYGISDAALFLAGTGNSIVSLRSDAEGEKPVLIATIKNAEAMRRAIVPSLKPDKALSDAYGFEALRDEDSTAVFAGGVILIGDSDAVDACLKSKAGGTSLAASPSLVALFRPQNTAVTLSSDAETAAAVADVLAEKSETNSSLMTVTETRFTRSAVERRVASELGFIGWLIGQMAD